MASPHAFFTGVNGYAQWRAGFSPVAAPIELAPRLLWTRRMKTYSALLVSTLALAACGTSIRETVINTPPRQMAARPIESVEMFTSGAPARPHVDVAFLEAEEASSLSTSETHDMLNELRKRGAQRGCDAIVVGGLSSRDPSLNDTETWLVDRPKGRKGIYATCIVYTAPPVAPPVAAQ